MVYSRRAMSAAAAVVTCGVLLAGCGSEGEDERTSTSSGSAQPEYDEAHIMAEVREAYRAFRALNPNAPIPQGADWVTDRYRESYNADNAELKDMGVVQKGKVTTKALHLAESDPDAPGGWQVTVYNCNVSTMRAYMDGEDVSTDPNDPDKPLAKGPRSGVSLDSYTTPDAGESWQVDDSQVLSESDAKSSPCDM